MQSFSLGQVVLATEQIVEGDFLGNPLATFPDRDYIHAEAGDDGIVEHVNGDNQPTVRFTRTGTATIVGPGEVAAVS